MKNNSYVPPSSLLVDKQQWNPATMRDDASLSSTLTADAAPRKPINPPPTIGEDGIQLSPNHGQQQQQQPVRNVRFTEEATCYYDNETQSREDCKEMWYSRAEYAQFKKEIIKCAKGIIRAEAKAEGNTMGGVLESAYVCCFECESDKQASCLHEFIPHEIQGFMKIHYRSEEFTSLGLERLIVRRISKDRQQLRKCLFDILFDMQKGNWPDKGILAGNIAKVSEEATRSSRLFARVLGSAQVPYLLTRRPYKP